MEMCVMGISLMGTDIVIAVLTTVGVCLVGLVFHALRDIKKTTNGIQKTVQENEVHLAKINGAVIKNASDLIVHIRSDDEREIRHARSEDEREMRHDAERRRRDEVLDQIWAKINQPT